MKTEKISITVPENIIKSVKTLAVQQDRSVSKMFSILLADALRNKAA